MYAVIKVRPFQFSIISHPLLEKTSFVPELKPHPCTLAMDYCEARYKCKMAISIISLKASSTSVVTFIYVGFRPGPRNFISTLFISSPSVLCASLISCIAQKSYFSAYFPLPSPLLLLHHTAS